MPPKPNSLASKSKKKHYCPICDENINDKKESIFCDSVLHGYIVNVWVSWRPLENSDALSIVYCTVSHQQCEITLLKVVVSNLSSELSSLKNELNVTYSTEVESLANIVGESSTYAQAFTSHPEAAAGYENG